MVPSDSALCIVLRRKAEEEIDKIRETPVESVANFGKYASGVWERLNGGEGESRALVTDLPRPQLMRKEREQNQLNLTLEVSLLPTANSGRPLGSVSKSRTNRVGRQSAKRSIFSKPFGLQQGVGRQCLLL